jgi:apolipoprotein N-acyltransferase
MVMEALCLGFLHYFPWNKAFRNNPKLAEIAIMAKMLAFMALFSWWLTDHGYGAVATTLWIGIGILASVRLALYLVDDYLDAKVKSAEGAEQVELLERGRDGKT